jgi:4-hydroxy-L-threonine phosphate dehydrogenase PdxA
MPTSSSNREAHIALFTGDPASIGPELVARLLADGAAQRLRISW